MPDRIEKRRVKDLVVVVGAFLVIASCTVTMLSIRDLGHQFEALLEVREMQSSTELTSKWVSDGIERQVKTFRQENEDAKDFAERHAEEVAAALQLFPAD